MRPLGAWGRLVRLGVYAVSAVLCLVGLFNSPGQSPLVILALMAMALGLFGALMYQSQEAQQERQEREWERWEENENCRDEGWPLLLR